MIEHKKVLETRVQRIELSRHPSNLLTHTSHLQNIKTVVLDLKTYSAHID